VGGEVGSPVGDSVGIRVGIGVAPGSSGAGVVGSAVDPSDTRASFLVCQIVKTTHCQIPFAKGLFVETGTPRLQSCP